MRQQAPLESTRYPMSRLAAPQPRAGASAVSVELETQEPGTDVSVVPSLNIWWLLMVGGWLQVRLCVASRFPRFEACLALINAYKRRCVLYLSLIFVDQTKSVRNREPRHFIVHRGNPTAGELRHAKSQRRVHYPWAVAQRGGMCIPGISGYGHGC